MCACKQSPATLVLHATAKDSVKLKKPGLVPWLFKCFKRASRSLVNMPARFGVYDYLIVLVRRKAKPTSLISLPL